MKEKIGKCLEDCLRGAGGLRIWQEVRRRRARDFVNTKRKLGFGNRNLWISKVEKVFIFIFYFTLANRAILKKTGPA